MKGKAVISLTTGLEDPEKVTVAFLGGGTAAPAGAGECFARALAAKDADALCALLADEVDFQALTPGRHWQASTGEQAVREIILARWFGDGDAEQFSEPDAVAGGVGHSDEYKRRASPRPGASQQARG